MIAANKPPLGEAYLQHISERPWSTYTEADYTPEQWHRACLIHQHTGAPTSKNQCKLPVRTPNGALNRNGVHSAMAALNGARGGVVASADEKMAARSVLSRLYKELGEEPPGFPAKHDDMSDDDLLIHFGVRGMKWGQRRAGSSGSSSSSGTSNKPKMSTGKKVAIGVTIAGGAAAVAYILSGRGRNSIGNMRREIAANRTKALRLRQAEAVSQKNYISDLRSKNPFSEHIRTRNNLARGRAGTDYTNDRDAILNRVGKTPMSSVMGSKPYDYF